MSPSVMPASLGSAMLDVFPVFPGKLEDYTASTSRVETDKKGGEESGEEEISDDDDLFFDAVYEDMYEMQVMEAEEREKQQQQQQQQEQQREQREQQREQREQQQQGQQQQEQQQQEQQLSGLNILREGWDLLATEPFQDASAMTDLFSLVLNPAADSPQDDLLDVAMQQLDEVLKAIDEALAAIDSAAEAWPEADAAEGPEGSEVANTVEEIWVSLQIEGAPGLRRALQSSSPGKRKLLQSLRELIAQRIYDTIPPAPPTHMIVDGGRGHYGQPYSGRMQQAAPEEGEQDTMQSGQGTMQPMQQSIEEQLEAAKDVAGEHGTMQSMQQSIVERLKAAKDELLGVGGGQV